MKDTHSMGNWEQVRAVADPLRLRILEVFSQKPMTTKQVATSLGEKPTRLYHHVEILERAGLIMLIETRKNRGTIEKYYSALALEFTIDRKLLERTKGARKATSGYEALFLSALEATLGEARKSVANGLITPVKERRNALMYRLPISGTEAEVESLMNEIREWIEEFQTKSRRRGEASYSLTIAFYPVKQKSKARSVRSSDQTKTARSKDGPDRS